MRVPGYNSAMHHDPAPPAAPPPAGPRPADPASAPEEPWVDPVIEAYKKGVDRTLIRETLRMTVEERFENLMALQRFALELRRAGQAASGSAANDR